jgi:hypothetical protein
MNSFLDLFKGEEKFDLHAYILDLDIRRCINGSDAWFPDCWVVLKNLNFSTSDDTLKEIFAILNFVKKNGTNYLLPLFLTVSQNFRNHFHTDLQVLIFAVHFTIYCGMFKCPTISMTLIFPSVINVFFWYILHIFMRNRRF